MGEARNSRRMVLCLLFNSGVDSGLCNYVRTALSLRSLVFVHVDADAGMVRGIVADRYRAAGLELRHIQP